MEFISSNTTLEKIYHFVLNLIQERPVTDQGTSEGFTLHIGALVAPTSCGDQLFWGDQLLHRRAGTELGRPDSTHRRCKYSFQVNS